MDFVKPTDRLLDTISVLVKRRDSTKAWLDIYLEAQMIDSIVASHLWEVLNGLEQEKPDEGDSDDEDGGDGD